MVIINASLFVISHKSQFDRVIIFYDTYLTYFRTCGIFAWSFICMERDSEYSISLCDYEKSVSFPFRWNIRNLEKHAMFAAVLAFVPLKK